MQFQLSRILQIAWKALFFCSVMLYSWVTIKLVTPVINQYAEQLIEPIIVKRLPHGFALGGAYLAWDELRPFIVLDGIDVVQSDSIPYVEHISHMDMRLDVIASWCRQVLVIDDIQIEHMKLAFAKEQIQLAQVESALTKVLGETRSRYKAHSYFTTPQSLSVNTLEIALGEHTITANQVSYKDHASYKDWNLIFRRSDDQSFFLQTIFTTRENNNGIEKADGQVLFRGTLPSYLLSFIPTPLVLDDFSGMLRGHFHYQPGVNATADFKHHLDMRFHYGDTPDLTIQTLKGHSVVTYQADEDWTINGQIDQLHINQVPSKPFTYQLTGNGVHQHSLNISQLNVAYTRALAPFLFASNNKLRRFLEHIRLRGGVENLAMVWEAPQFSLSAFDFTLLDFSSTASAKIPGLSGLQAHISLENDQGVIQLFTQNGPHNHVVEVANKGWFDHSIVLDVAPMQIRFTHQDDNWVFDSEAFKIGWAQHMIHGSGHMILRSNSYPDLQLVLGTDSITMSDIQRGLPAKWLPRGLNNYLQRAVKAGSLRHNTLTLDAHPQKGRMVWTYNWEAQLQDIMMHYAPEWPAAEHARGHIRLHNTQLDIDLDQLFLDKQRIRQSHVSIADISRPQVDVHMHDLIDLQRGLSFIHKSPLEDKIGRHLSRAQIQGAGVLDMSFSIDVRDKLPKLNKLTGKIDLAHDTIAFPEYHIDMKEVSGALFFTDTTLHAPDVSGKQGSEALTISLDSQENNMAIGFRGHVDLLSLLQDRLPSALLSRISGRPYLQGRILIDALDKKPHWTVEAEAPHGGIAVDLPPPLRLHAKQKQPVKALLHIKEDVVQDIQVRYPEAVEVDWQQGGESAESRLAILAPRFVYKAWEPLLAGDGLHMALPPLQLHVKEGLFYGYSFADMALSVRHTDNQFTVQVESPQVAGQIMLQPHKSLTAKLSRLVFPNKPEGTFSTSNLSGLDYTVAVDDLQIASHHYRHLDLLLKQKYAGYTLDHIDVETSGNHFNMHGQWEHGAKPKTYLEGQIDSVDLGAFLRYFPDIDSLQGGKGITKFKLTWPQSLEKLRIKDMRGIVNFNLAEGKISNLGETAEAGIGVGVLFNILSLNSLINKIAFDFSDLGHESYPFDALIGDFTLGHGKIKTDKIMVKGKLGTVYSRGTVDIKNARLDVYLTILPIVTSSLPTIAALAGGAVAGIIAWTASQLIEAPVSELALQAYHITGAVDNPILTELDKNHLPDTVILA